MTAAQIAESIGGTLVAGDGSAVAASVSTSSKDAPAGCVFVALRGDRHDGHAYLGDIGGRATVALVDRDVAAVPGVAMVKVPDTRRALGRLASVVRRSITRPKVIAIAGSNGKTSTKNTLHRVLSQTLRGTASPASFNNDIGVPATIFPVDAEDDYVVLEIGTNHPGEVEHLSRMSEPDIAVITSIGEEHLEFFHTLDNVRKENAAIVAGLRPGGLLVACDDVGLTEAIDYAGPIVRFGTTDRVPRSCTQGRGVAGEDTALGTRPWHPDFIVCDVRVTLDGTHFRVDEEPFFVPAVGAHFATNALAVIAVARHLGLNNETIRTGLATAEASSMRMQKREINGVALLNDAYNANPTSVRAALDTLRQIDRPGRKIVVLGEMKELGDHSAAAHAGIADAVRALRPDATFVIGEAWRKHATAAGATWFPTSDDAAQIAGQIMDGDLVLLKGSRSMKLERVADAIEASQADGFPVPSPGTPGEG